MSFDIFSFTATAQRFVEDYWLPLAVALLSFAHTLFHAIPKTRPPVLFERLYSDRSRPISSRNLAFFLWALAATIANIGGIRISTGTYRSVWDVFLSLGLAMFALTLILAIEVAASIIRDRRSRGTSLTNCPPARRLGLQAMVTASVFVDFVLSLMFILYLLEVQ
jgi:hypothetical protein